MTGITFRYSSILRIAAGFCGASLPALLLTWLFSASALGQNVPYYEDGKGVAPAYEGWVANEDGSFTMLFGYMNENWEEELNVPVGANNSFSPGPADRGQPTRFLPRRNRNVFGISVPADFGSQELVWTLVTREGVTQKAFGSLRKDYVLEPITIMSESGTVGGGSANGEDVQTNLPPQINFEGELNRSVKVGESLPLVVMIHDDDKPLPRNSQGRNAVFEEDDTPRERLEKALQPPIRGTVNRVVGFYFAWFVYRGTGEVSFEPLQAKTWEDTRAFQNSPWSPYWTVPEPPEDNRWLTHVTFYQPGDYLLRGRADDGGLVSDVEVRVRVLE